MHYHIDMIPHDKAFVEPVDGTGWSKLVTECELSKRKEQSWDEQSTLQSLTRMP